MSIRKRKGSANWWVDITAPGGQRVRRSTGTANRKKAQEFHDRLKAELWRQKHFGEKPKRSFEEACLLFLRASKEQKDYRTKVRHVKFWREIFKGRAICSLTSDEVMDNLPTHRAYKDKKSLKLSNATRNRYLASMNRIFTLALEAGWIDKKPILRTSREPAVRVRWLTYAQAQQLLDAIQLQWVKDVVEFALATGCRAGEIFSLTWDDVDIGRKAAWVTADRAKSGRSRPIPLNDNALAVINRRKGSHKELVFSRRPGGPQIDQIDRREFNSALDKIGVEDFRFHDLRHTWASWHVQNGTPLFVLKELGGWETLEMVKKYAHLDAGHLAQYANHVTFSSQSDKGEKKSGIGVRLIA